MADTRPEADDGQSFGNPGRPYSIDLAIELEHQLADESSSCTPTQVNGGKLDPPVSASQLAQLRHSLAEITNERDELQQMLSRATFQAAGYKDSLQHMTDKCLTLEMQLEESRQKNKDDEEAIVLLRSKVEESRRAVMRLQAESRESRRLSQVPTSLDISKGVFAGLVPPSNKRSSFSPLTGSGIRTHSRSISTYEPAPSTPSTPTLIEPPDPPLGIQKPKSRSPSRRSGRENASSDVDDNADASALIVTSLRHEIESLRADLEKIKHELAESNEAREASETCVKALQDFIGENNVGCGASTSQNAATMRLPPMPTMTSGDEPDTCHVRRDNTTSGWKFKLWKSENAVKPAALPSNVLSATAPPSPNPELSSRKFGGFFGPRAGTPSPVPPSTIPTHVSTIPTHSWEHVSSASDASTVDSVAEPVSPAACEHPNLDLSTQSCLEPSGAGATDHTKHAKVHALEISTLSM